MPNFIRPNYPSATIPTAKKGGVVKPCIHCHKQIKLGRWDSWNGFLVRCPFCSKLHGKHMNPKGILWASFFINALSFLFTLRLRSALLLIVIFVVTGFIGNHLLNIEFFPQPVEFCLVIIFLFLPVFMNTVFIMNHESNLRLASGSKVGKTYELFSNLQDLVSRLW